MIWFLSVIRSLLPLLAGTVRCPLIPSCVGILRLSVSSSSRKSLWKESVPLKPAGEISDVLYYFFGSTPEDSYRLLVCMIAEKPAYIQAPESRLAQRIIGLIPIRYRKREAAGFRVIADEVSPAHWLRLSSGSTPTQPSRQRVVYWRFYKGALTMHPLTPRLSLLATATAIVSSLVNSHVPEPYLVCLLLNSRYLIDC